MKYFGSSGIRGLYGSAVTPELAMKAGAAVGALGSPVAIGRDHRATSPLLSSALASGAMSAGADVLDAGLVPTPTLAHAARNAASGAMLTASHNPPEYNGVKLWNPDGLAFVTPQMEIVENLIDAPRPPVAWGESGGMTRIDSAVESHVSAIASAVNLERPLKVAVDCGGGATSLAAPALIEALGCAVVPVNCAFDPSMKCRTSEPTEAALAGLKSAVVREMADVGIAHDGDGDRMVAISADGRYLGGEELMQVFAGHAGTKRAAAPVNASLAFGELLGTANVTFTRVGDVYVGEALKLHGGDLGCEPSGTWIFPKFSLCPDGLYAAARLLELVSRHGSNALADGVKRYPMANEKIASGDIPSAMTRIGAALEAQSPRATTRLDGIRVDFDWGWLLARASGTEPVIRVTVEARDDAQLEKHGRALLSKVREAVRG